jgi:HKD family nuclease
MIITNDGNNNLKKKLQELIPDSKEVKILVGYCHFSGIKELHETLKKLYGEGRLSREHIKILIGLYNTDENRNMEKKDRFIQDLTNSVVEFVEKAFTSQELDDEEIYDKVEFFIKLLKEEIIIIKKTIEPNHAKLYLFKTKEISAPNLFITGSSNLTRAGLVSQNEFNVPIQDDDRFKKAEKHFDKLWKNAILLSENDIRRLDKALSYYNKPSSLKEKEKRDTVIKHNKKILCKSC